MKLDAFLAKILRGQISVAELQPIAREEFNR
jgi:hypothetical protein